MRFARITAEPGQTGVYHCMSRVVGAQRLLDDVCKQKLVQLLHTLAAFCGVEVITYCMMSNHFHVLVRVPPPPGHLSDQDLLQRMEQFYGKRGVLTALARASLHDGRPIDRDIRESIVSRMGNVSVFIQEFKQRFSRWYNRIHQRPGYFWGERFRSVLVEDSPHALRAMAAYIDLNPIRAGLVDDPKNYRFCGYAAALAGDAQLRRSLSGFLGEEKWAAASAEYRKLLHVTGGTSGRSDKKVIDPDVIRQELARGGKLELGQILRLRIRHMTDGVILGSKAFVNETFARHRDRFGPKRRDGARPIRGAPLPDLAVARDLRVNAVG